MPGIVRTAWFGKQISVLMVNGKTVSGELSEVTDRYIVLRVGNSQTQVMDHAIVAIRLAADKEVQQA
jgi:sRNA-binding regulator protein Hfq